MFFVIDNMNDNFENIVQSDPTLKYLMRDATFDFDLLEHQMRVREAAILIAISKWLETIH